MTEQEQTASASAPRRVVVAEDESLIRLDIVEILRDNGFDVVGEAGDGETAVQLATELRPDLVIMDLRLGDEVDAVEILLAIKQAPSPTAEIPVLICSASRDLIDTHMELLERLGCEVVDKPFGIDDLLAAIDRCLTPIQETNGAH